MILFALVIHHLHRRQGASTTTIRNMCVYWLVDGFSPPIELVLLVVAFGNAKNLTRGRESLERERERELNGKCSIEGEPGNTLGFQHQLIQTEL